MTANKRNTDPFAPLPVKKVNVKRELFNDSLAIPQLEANYRNEQDEEFDDELYGFNLGIEDEWWGDRD